MRIIYKKTEDSRMFYVGIHEKIYTVVYSATFGAKYTSNNANVEKTEFGLRYNDVVGISQVAFNAPYQNGRVPIERTVYFRAGYNDTHIQYQRALFKSPYRYNMSMESGDFALFSVPYNTTTGRARVSTKFGAKYISNNSNGDNFRCDFVIKYRHNKIMKDSSTFVALYKNNQIEESNAITKFNVPYKYMMSTYAAERTIQEADIFGELHDKRIQLYPTFVDGPNRHILIPIAVGSLIKDRFGKNRDFDIFINLPPVLFNYKISGLDVLDKASYTNIANKGPLFEDEKKINKIITSRIESISTGKYKDFSTDVVEIRVYGVGDIQNIGESYIPGISYSICSKNGDSRYVILRDGAKYVNDDIWDFGNKFANLAIRQIDTRDETGNSGFSNKVIATGTIMPIRIKKQSICCLDRTISISKTISSCYIPKSGSTIKSVSSLTQESMSINPLDGFSRIEGQSLVSSVVDRLGIPFDQEEKEGSLEEVLTYAYSP